MFNDEFFPTPKSVIEKMLQHVNLDYTKYLLEPNAGKGDILDFIRESRYHDRPQIYAIEKEPELRMILNEKDYKVIGDDFLEFNSDMHFDYILMNPPFSNGDEHLLKAWEILQSGTIVCLLNSQTLKNPHTKRRKQLLNIISYYNGEVYELGNAFNTAERKTNVEVSMVVLKKEGQDRFKFDVNYDKEEQTTLDEETLNSQIATNNVISNLVTYFNLAKDTAVEFIKSKEKMRFYIEPLTTGEAEYRNRDLLTEIVKENSNNSSYNTFIDSLKSSAWNKVLDQPSINSMVTSSVRGDLNEFIRQKKDMDFTENNIKKIITELMLNKENILFKCVVDVFENMCSYDKDNEIHIEGWKTNSAYKVNKRVILPYFIEYRGWSSSPFDLYQRRGMGINDIDKAMCLVDGTSFENIYSIGEALRSQFRIISVDGYKMGQTNKCESKYFNIKFYKKGTLHLQFKDDKVWERFNVMAAQGKNWIGTEDHEEYKQLIQGD